MAIKISSKKPLKGNKRSHSNRATKHSRKPNMQLITINGVKIKTSAREARTLRKMAAAA